MLDLSTLRFISENGTSPDNPPPITTLDECIRAYGLEDILDEAYYGRKPIEPIQQAMDKIYAKVMADPVNYRIQGSYENRVLQEAIRKTFGFKRVNVYWRSIDTAMPEIKKTAVEVVSMKFIPMDPLSRAAKLAAIKRIPDANMGPHTVTRTAAFGGPKSVQPGTNDAGFYNSERNLCVHISFDQFLFTRAGLTSEEAVGMLLHEIGHNFDFTVSKIIGAWVEFIRGLIDIILLSPFLPNIATTVLVGHYVGTTAIVSLIRNNAPELFNLLINWDDIVLSMIPPIRVVSGFVSTGTTVAVRFLRSLMSPVRVVAQAPRKLLYMPINFIENYFTRRSETFADSFAAQYGYGAELGTALVKFRKYRTSGFVDSEETILAPIYDLAHMNVEFLSLISMEGHQTIAKRFKITMDTLDQDLMQSDLDPKTKQEIMNERNRIEAAYDAYMKCDPTWRNFFTSIYNKCIDSWFAGKNYLVIPNVFGSSAYAN